MATHITLVNFTQKRIEKIKESPNRLDSAKKTFQAMGAEVKDFFLVMGRYDIVLISKAPNDETVAKVGHFYMVILNSTLEGYTEKR
jgi:uncharacterized protein with GYD domain